MRNLFAAEKQKYIFNFDANDEKKLLANLGTIKAIEEQTSQYKAVFTTNAAAFGINFFPEAHVVMTEVPTDINMYFQ